MNERQRSSDAPDAPLQPLGIDLYLHQQHVDITTPSGRAVFQMMGVFAQFERAMICERVSAGLARAKANGKVLGRPKVKPAVEQRIRHLRAQGMGMLSVCIGSRTERARRN